MLLLFLLYLLPLVYGRGRFFAHHKTVDRVKQDGKKERSYIVTFNDDGPDFGRNSSNLTAWLDTQFSIKSENVQHMYHVNSFRGYSAWMSADKVQHILDHESTKHVEENSVVKTTDSFTVRPDWGQARSNQHGLRRLGTPGSLYTNGYPDGGADTSVWNWNSGVYVDWNGTKGRINQGRGAKIWMVDTGVRATHQELTGRAGTMVDCTYSHWYGCTVGSAFDCNGHGTHTAGLAAGRYRGMASRAKVEAIRVLDCDGSGLVSDIVAALSYISANVAQNFKANIISMSLGGTASQSLDDAVRACVRANIIVVVAAGNDGGDACNSSPSRASTGSDGVITVMASNAHDESTSFTNTGSCATVFAPGYNIHSSWAAGDQAYATLSGTSMATPLVAGSIALYATQQPAGLTPAMVKAAIQNFGTKNLIKGTLLPGTPNLLINARWQ